MKIKQSIVIILIMAITIANMSFAKSETNNFEVKVNYFYNENNNTVTAIIYSNNELDDTKPTWNLSYNKKEYKKIFNDNIHYYTPVQDIFGNIINVELNITRN